MSDVLCIYYSRTGNTKSTMLQIAQALDAEVVEIRDGVERSGVRGWLRCGMDAMSRTVPPVSPFETEKALSQYRLVILGTPVWAGRCSGVMRSFLKKYGKKLPTAAYVLLRAARIKMRRSTNRWTAISPAATALLCPFAAALWAMPSGRRNFSARCGTIWTAGSKRTLFSNRRKGEG